MLALFDDMVGGTVLGKEIAIQHQGGFPGGDPFLYIVAGLCGAKPLLELPDVDVHSGVGLQAVGPADTHQPSGAGQTESVQLLSDAGDRHLQSAQSGAQRDVRPEGVDQALLMNHSPSRQGQHSQDRTSSRAECGEIRWRTGDLDPERTEAIDPDVTCLSYHRDRGEAFQLPEDWP